MILNSGDNRGGSINSAAIAASIPIVTLLLLLLGVGITISVTIISRRRKYCLQPKDEGKSFFHAKIILK